MVTTAPHDLGRCATPSRRPALKPCERRPHAGADQTVEVADEGEAKKILRLMDAIDDHDDVQNVYANFDIPDEILDSFEG